MPNKKGGKNYKKTKHAEDEPILYELLPGQMYARILKLVGGCNAIALCNDGRERLVHIRGNMRRKVWIATGDIVLISLRELEGGDRGDICARYDPRIIYRLQQKDKSINPKLFSTATSDKTDGQTNGFPDDNGDGFDFDNNNEVINEVMNENSDSDEDDNNTKMPTNHLAQKSEMNDNIDIDNI
jgi:translation initiation factor 1A